MAKTCSISMVGDKEVIGALDTSFLAPGSKIYPGTLAVNGPVYCGLIPNQGIPMETVKIGHPIGIPASPPYSLQVDGISHYRSGITNFYTLNNYYALCTKYAPTIRNSTSITHGVNTKNALNVANDNAQFNANHTIAGKCTVGGVLTVGGAISCAWLNGQLAVARALPGKSFDIKHPSKDNMRLRYGCLEGPELGVYVRGKLEDKSMIELPYYWKDLVNPDTITVQLTSEKVYQELTYEVLDWGTKVKVKNERGGAINCSYLIHAMRKDLEPLITEYEGTSAKDYPGQDFLKMNEITTPTERHHDDMRRITKRRKK